jgi:hypothetical protein
VTVARSPGVTLLLATPGVVVAAKPHDEIRTARKMRPPDSGELRLPAASTKAPVSRSKVSWTEGPDSCFLSAGDMPTFGDDAPISIAA